MTDLSKASLLLRNAQVVLSDHVAPVSLLVVDGRIASIVEPGVGTQTAEHDLSGITLFPGFIDVHIHGAVGVDAMEAKPEDLKRVSRFLATQGVTGWLPTLVPGPSEQYESA